MPLLLVIMSFSPIGSAGSVGSGLIVEVEVDRPPRGFLRGPRWVSLNSTGQSVTGHLENVGYSLLFVRFQDMMSGPELLRED